MVRLPLLAALLVGLVALAPVLAGCGDSDSDAEAAVLQSDAERETPDVAPETLQALVEGNTAFALAAFSVLAEREGNLFFSPYSISIALAMTHGGARGETAQEMAAALHFALPEDQLHPAFNALEQELSSRAEVEEEDGQPFQLRVANSIWGQEGFDFRPQYLDLLAINYGAGLRVTDFEADPEAARQTINDWVSEQTGERIQDLFPERSITNLTRLVLANAIYFNAAWDAPFDPENTGPGPFTLLDGEEVEADMMRQSGSFGYAETEGIQAVELLYEGGQLSMMVILPQEGQFETVQSALDAGQLGELLGAIAPAEVQLTMPKFSFESSFTLREMFEALGMVQAFDEMRADFSGMRERAEGEPNLFISSIVHKAFVDVAEEGTEAAAATGVVVGVTGAPIDEVTVSVDRPFLFLIRDIPTGAILFMGRVVDPR